MKIGKQEFTNRDLIILLLGVVLGGMVIGFVDSNRPTPLFSSAMFGDSDGYEACLESSGYNQMQSEIDDFIAAQSGTPMSPATQDLVNRWLNQLNAIGNSCNQGVSPEGPPVN